MSDDDDEGSRPRRRLFRRRARAAGVPRFDLRKALFILPNAFTVSSIFCGFYAVLRATSGEGPQSFQQAGLALFFACFFDVFDGRVARMTRTQSDFGVQIDSLADVISFGVAPAILVYHWALKGLHPIVGLAIAFAYCACGAIRLARFNVLAARGHGSLKYFIGLPIPGAAMMIVALVVAQSVWIHESVEAKASIAALVVVLSYLMVSRVRFRTFKDFRPSVRTTPILVAVLAALGLAVVVLKASVTLVLAVGSYILLGLVEEVVFFRRRRREATALAAAAPPAPPHEHAPAPH
ncbi:MAG: CDP-diacylglycerol--serine O-phosphatidyltransferase [Deltaproteobacteria bacterium]|nr:CDP-diacylglycerol--serine O-phosphatidyltransferase [Deltaproteobacteria bacterium]